MKASYNRLGQMISEKWYKSTDILDYEYAYAYDNQGNLVKTIDKKNNKEYNLNKLIVTVIAHITMTAKRSFTISRADTMTLKLQGL